MKKTSYPCGISSSGQAWLLHCAECKQVWHNVCAGLKADFTKHVLDSLFRSWQCPWCYTCPYPRSDNHHSVKREQELKDKLLTAETIQCIKESVSKVIERALPMNWPRIPRESLVWLQDGNPGIQMFSPDSTISTNQLLWASRGRCHSQHKVSWSCF